ncbi:MAG: RidA family protein [Deltaproteobacteria bacterium]|nr:RidA family protein [Deltaproteobacteria bacterium]
MEIKRYQTKARMSRAVEYGGTIYFCGQVAKDDTADIMGQTATTLEKIEELLNDVGSDKTKLLSVTIYLSDMANFKQMNEVWDTWVTPGQPPARACVEAKMARPELLVEMSVIAAK